MQGGTKFAELNNLNCLRNRGVKNRHVQDHERLVRIHIMGSKLRRFIIFLKHIDIFNTKPTTG